MNKNIIILSIIGGTLITVASVLTISQILISQKIKTQSEAQSYALNWARCPLIEESNECFEIIRCERAGPRTEPTPINLTPAKTPDSTCYRYINYKCADKKQGAYLQVCYDYPCRPPKCGCTPLSKCWDRDEALKEIRRICKCNQPTSIPSAIPTLIGPTPTTDMSYATIPPQPTTDISYTPYLSPTPLPPTPTPIVDYRHKGECNIVQNQKDGGQGVYEYLIPLGKGTGEVEFYYNTYQIPDRFRIYYGGVQVYKSELKTPPPNKVTKDYLANLKYGYYPGIQGLCSIKDDPDLADKINKIAQKPSSDLDIVFNKSTAYPDYVVVYVDAPCNSTLWEFLLGCPGDMAPTPTLMPLYTVREPQCIIPCKIYIDKISCNNKKNQGCFWCSSLNRCINQTEIEIYDFNTMEFEKIPYQTCN